LGDIEANESADGTESVRTRLLTFAVPDRATLLWMSAFAVLCIVLVVTGSTQRVGDGGEYVAMSYQFANLRPPAMSLWDLADIDRHYAALGDSMATFRGSARSEAVLLSNGRYDQLHFWIYPLLAAPFVKLTHWFGVADTYGFAAMHVVLAVFTFGVVLRRKGAVAASLLFISPLLWWIDKPHGELVVFCLLLLALLWTRDRPHLGLLCLSVLAAHNMSLTTVLATYGIWLLILHGRSLFDSGRKWAALVAAVVIAGSHPVYYLVRLGAIDPIRLIEVQKVRVPTVTRFITPVLDPYAGLVMWWPALVLAAGVGAVLRAWHRPLVGRTLREWAAVWAPFVVAMALLFAQAQITQPASGGTFALTRYGVWFAPFAVFAFGHHRSTRRVTQAGVAICCVASAVLSFHVARPDRPDVWFTVAPTFVSDAVNDHAPWLWNPVPQIFLTREHGQYTPIEPVANESCTKLLAVSGRWPGDCPTPTDVPSDCAASYFCYANRSGDDYFFQPVDQFG
jgi:hypothetical protein